ncbi:unnamed protein product [Schistocephalus solidus]|uniref:Uncharacterized protein n=1 Tax=Schistocephalus solidus TaxID=70667 RepID=A0A3P7C526_SCHSO|nr:unnamed protein product [Schistocephalus solidus]
MEEANLQNNRSHGSAGTRVLQESQLDGTTGGWLERTNDFSPKINSKNKTFDYTTFQFFFSAYAYLYIVFFESPRNSSSNRVPVCQLPIATSLHSHKFYF